LGPAAGPVLGYVGEINDRQLKGDPDFEGVEPGTIVGQSGLELQYNRQIMGHDGFRRIIVNSRGVEVAEEERQLPVDGPSATLTLDLDLQAALEECTKGQAAGARGLSP